MKPLYYLEVAPSIKNGKIIPAKKLDWKIMDNVAYEDRNACDMRRIHCQKRFDHAVVRIAKASFFKNIFIRMKYNSNHTFNEDDWIIVN